MQSDSDSNHVIGTTKGRWAWKKRTPPDDLTRATSQCCLAFPLENAPRDPMTSGSVNVANSINEACRPGTSRPFQWARTCFFGNTGGHFSTPIFPHPVFFNRLACHPSERPVCALTQALGSVSEWNEGSDASSALRTRVSGRPLLLATAGPISSPDS